MATRKQKAKREMRYASVKDAVAKRDAGFTPTTFKVPKGWKTFKFDKAKTYEIDVLPYVVGSKSIIYEQGTLAAEHNFHVHPRVGPNKLYAVCNRLTFKGGKCAACNHRAKLASTPDNEAEADALKPSLRQLRIVVDRRDKKKTPMLMECAYYGKGKGFGEMLDSKIRHAKKDSPRLNFFHLTGGMTLQVGTIEDKFQGRTFYKADDIEMVDREEDYPEELLDTLPSLDELIIPADYKALKDACEGNVSDEEEDEDTTGDDDEDTEEDEGEEEDEEEEEKPKAKAKKKKVEEDDEENDDEGDGDDDDNDEESEDSDESEEDEDESSEDDDDGDGDDESEDDDEDERPTKKVKKPVKKATKKAKDEEEEDEDDEFSFDDDEEEEKPKKKKK